MAAIAVRLAGGRWECTRPGPPVRSNAFGGRLAITLDNRCGTKMQSRGGRPPFTFFREINMQTYQETKLAEKWFHSILQSNCDPNWTQPMDGIAAIPGIPNASP
jgi:hypothetical protein